MGWLLDQLRGGLRDYEFWTLLSVPMAIVIGYAVVSIYREDRRSMSQPLRFYVFRVRGPDGRLLRTPWATWARDPGRVIKMATHLRRTFKGHGPSALILGTAEHAKLFGLETPSDELKQWAGGEYDWDTVFRPDD